MRLANSYMGELAALSSAVCWNIATRACRTTRGQKLTRSGVIGYDSIVYDYYVPSAPL